MDKLVTFVVVVISVYFVLFLPSISCNQDTNGAKDAKEAWKKKDIRDYTDADLERLYDQWEEDEEPLEDDELPEHLRPQPKIDMSQIDPNDPEGMLKLSKKGKTLMIFASVSGDPEQKETEQISSLWQSSLFNANMEVQRYVVDKNRVLFVLTDGSKAWEMKDFLINQDRCDHVTIEGRNYPGKGAKDPNAFSDFGNVPNEKKDQPAKPKSKDKEDKKKKDKKKKSKNKKEEL